MVRVRVRIGVRARVMVSVKVRVRIGVSVWMSAPSLAIIRSTGVSGKLGCSSIPLAAQVLSTRDTLLHIGRGVGRD